MNCRLNLLLLMIAGFTGCGGAGPATGTPEATTAPTADFPRGPQGGRLLSDGAFAVELRIFEDGVPPEYHVHLYENGMPLPPTAAEVEVRLDRLGGVTDRIRFAPEADFLRGNGTVREPHSFEVTVDARRNGQASSWHFESFEGRTIIPAPIAEASGLGTALAGPATILDTVPLTGRVVFDAEQVRAVRARFPGPVRGVAVSVGDSVRAGAVLATIESNESLTEYTVRAPIDGVVVERRTNPGETAGDQPLFVIARPDRLWAELSVFPRDLARLHAGQRVRLRSVEGTVEGAGRVLRVLPAASATGGDAATLPQLRVAIDAPDPGWQPGLFVAGEVEVGAVEVPVAVERRALQTFRDFDVVFEQVGDTYEVRMLTLGRRDRDRVEVTGGIQAGARYVTANSYLVKADIEKSGASHDH